MTLYSSGTRIDVVSAAVTLRRGFAVRNILADL
jgi:hypothetical protein